MISRKQVNAKKNQQQSANAPTVLVSLYQNSYSVIFDTKYLDFYSIKTL